MNKNEMIKEITDYLESANVIVVEILYDTLKKVQEEDNESKNKC